MTFVSTLRPGMEQILLKHMMEMTCHRDQALLDISVITALHELVNVSQLRALEIFRSRDELYLRQRAWICDGEVVSAAENPLNDQGGEPVANYPVLLSCIAERRSLAEEVAADGSFKLWLPVWIDDKIATCLEISNPRPYPKRVLGVIEGILSIYRNYQNLLDFSERDSLTGLLNRKSFDARFSKMAAANALADVATHAEQPERRGNQADIHAHWLAVVDIDLFKRVNDQFGHLYGDEVLILLANLLRSSFRAQDRVFRFGGEEFVVLLHSASIEDAVKAFERFRRNVEQHEFPQVGTITVSIGFVCISNETPVVILGHADQALYYAKANGRNRVCHYDQMVSRGLLHSEMSKESVEFFFEELPPA